VALDKLWHILQRLKPSKTQSDTKKTVITKNRITSKIVFRLTQPFSCIRSSLCCRHLQSFKSVLQKLFVSLALKKCAPNELPGAAGTFGSGGQVLDDPPAFFSWNHSYCCCDCCLQVTDSLGVVAIHHVLKVSPQIKSGGFKSDECGDHCGSHLRLITRSGKRCCSHANDSFEDWGLAPYCWIHWRTLTTPLRRPSAVQNLTSPTHRLAWAVDNRVSDSSSVVWCPWWFRSSRVWLSVSVFTIEVMHSPMGSELVHPFVDHWVDRKFTTSAPFFELHLSCVDRLLPKICLNYKYLLLGNPRHLEGEIW